MPVMLAAGGFTLLLLFGTLALAAVAAVLLLVRWVTRGKASHWPDLAGLKRIEAGIARMEQRVANLEIILLENRSGSQATAGDLNRR